MEKEEVRERGGEEEKDMSSYVPDATLTQARSLWCSLKICRPVEHAHRSIRHAAHVSTKRDEQAAVSIYAPHCNAHQ